MKNMKVKTHKILQKVVIDEIPLTNKTLNAKR